MGIIWLYLVITLSFTEIIFFCYILIEKIQTFIFVVSLSSHRSRGPCYIKSLIDDTELTDLAWPVEIVLILYNARMTRILHDLE